MAIKANARYKVLGLNEDELPSTTHWRAKKAEPSLNVRARLRVLVKRILSKYGQQPDKQANATETVLRQAAVLSEEWAVA